MTDSWTCAECGFDNEGASSCTFCTDMAGAGHGLAQALRAVEQMIHDTDAANADGNMLGGGGAGVRNRSGTDLSIACPICPHVVYL